MLKYHYVHGIHRWLFFVGLFFAAVTLPNTHLSAIEIPTIDSAGKPVDLEEALNETPDFYVQQMTIYLRRGDLDRAGYLASHLVNVRPNNVDARGVLSLYLAAKGDIAAAKQELRLAEIGGEENPHTLYAKAMLFRLEKNYDSAVKACNRAISRDDTHPYPWNILGRVYYDQGKDKQALDCFQKSVSLSGDFLPGYSNLGATAYILGNDDLAAACFQKVIELNPTSYVAHYGLALVMERGGQYARSIQELKKSLDINPNNPPSLQKLGEVQVKVGRYQEALSTGKLLETRGIEGAYEILADASLHLNDPRGVIKYLDKAPGESAGTDYLRGFSYMLQGQYEQALNQMEKALEKDKAHFGAFSAARVLRMYTGQKTALKDDGGVEWNPSLNKFLHFIDGCLFAEQDNWPEALKEWHAAEGLIDGFSMQGIGVETLKENMKQKEFKYISMGALYYLRNLHDHSLSEFNRALEINGESILTNYWAAQVYLRKGDRRDAVERFQNAISRAPGFYAALYGVGELRFVMGEAQDAVEYYKRALSVKNDAGILIKLGLIYESSRAYDKAERAYEELIELQPELFVGYNQLAWLYAKRGIRLDRAMGLAEKAIKLQPGNASILDTIGWIHFHKRDYERALLNIEKSNKMLPDNPTVLYHLGATYHAMAHRNKAKEYLERALEISQDFEEAEEVRRLLNE